MTKKVTSLIFFTNKQHVQARMWGVHINLILFGVLLSMPSYSYSGKIVSVEKCTQSLNGQDSPFCQKLPVSQDQDCHAKILDETNLQKKRGKSFEAHFSFPAMKIKNKRFLGHLNFYNGNTLSGFVEKGSFNKSLYDKKSKDKYSGYISAWMGAENQDSPQYSVLLEKVIFTLEKIESSKSPLARTHIDFTCQIQE